MTVGVKEIEEESMWKREEEREMDSGKKVEIGYKYRDNFEFVLF